VKQELQEPYRDRWKTELCSDENRVIGSKKLIENT
jgi:hypothetical protein